MIFAVMQSLFRGAPQHIPGFREDVLGAENHQTVIFQDLDVAVRNDVSAFPPDQQLYGKNLLPWGGFEKTTRSLRPVKR